ncbi:hypothetical protein ScPMuIL_006637, partial [Solemya velum]
LCVDCVVNKPKCNKDDTWFPNGNTFMYSYTSSVSSSFMGVTDSKSGFEFGCQIEINVPKKCEAVMQVYGCVLMETQEGSSVMVEAASSMSFNRKMSRNPVYFQMNRGEILENSIIIPEKELEAILNLKRGILSALQVIRRKSPNLYNDPITQTDIFGECSTKYTVVSSKMSDLHLQTERNIRLCKLPHAYEQQARLFSLAKSLHGQTDRHGITEDYYPFSSTVRCDVHGTLFSLNQVECLQQQAFIPLAHNGSSGYTTAMTNISQSLQFQKKIKLTTKHVDRSLDGKKLVGLEFVVEPEQEVVPSQSDIMAKLHALMKSLEGLEISTWPQGFSDLVQILRNSEETVLQGIVKSLWDGQSKKMLHSQQFYLEGLLSCGSQACLQSFYVCVDQGYVSGFQGKLFLMDMALTHRPIVGLMRKILDVCKVKPSPSCWLPLGVMINKLAHSPKLEGEGMNIIQEAMSTLRQMIGDNCKHGIMESMHAVKMAEHEAEVLLALKTVGNIGAAAQDLYDGNAVESRQLVRVVFQCMQAKNIPDTIPKAAILAIKKMNLTEIMKEALFKVIRDINQIMVVRTTAFSILLHDGAEDTIKQLLGIIHQPTQMNSLKSYMETLLQSVLESDQPELQSLKNKWKELITEDGRNLTSDSNVWGTSKYLDLTKFFKLPWFSEMAGLQVELISVYHPSSIVFQNVVLRINYYYGGMQPLLEIDVDMKGFDSMVAALFGSKGHGILSALKMMGKARMSGDRHKPTNFTYFDPDIISEIVQMLNQANVGAVAFPEAIFNVKLLGYELGYLSLADMLDLISGGSQGKERRPTLMETLLQGLQQGMALVRTRSSRIIDLVKVIPTVSGAPLNMTVLTTYVLSTEANAKADLSQFFRKIGPVIGDGRVVFRGALEFSGIMSVKLVDEKQISGIMMKVSAQAENDVGCRVEYSQGGQPKSHQVGISFLDNIDFQQIQTIRGEFFIRHHQSMELVQSDSRYEVQLEDCWPSLFTIMTGRNLCIKRIYPNVTESDSHAYFPLSGPFEFGVHLKREDLLLKSYNFNIQYTPNGTQSGAGNRLDINFAAPGSKLKRIVNMTAEVEQEDSDVQLKDIEMRLEVPEMQTGVMFEMMRRQEKDIAHHFDLTIGTLSGGEWNYGVSIQAHKVNSTGQTLPGAPMFMSYQLDLDVRLPHVSLQTSLSNRLDFSPASTGLSTSLTLIYYCAPTRPILYMFHVDPKTAASRQNTTEIVFTNLVTTSKQSASENMQLTYPGQNVISRTELAFNGSYAERESIISWLNCGGQRENMTMSSHVENKTVTDHIHYVYSMDGVHKDYKFILHGFVQGNLKNLEVFSDLNFEPNDENGGTDVACKNKYPPMSNKWVGSLHFTLKAVPVMAPPQPQPVAITFLWNLKLNHPVEALGDNSFVASGTLGKNLANTINKYKYWCDVNVDFVMPNGSSVDQLHRQVTLSVEYTTGHLLNFTEAIRSPYGTCDVLLFYQKDENAKLDIHNFLNLQTVWSLLNFYHNETYEIDKGSVLHFVNSTNPLFQYSESSTFSTLPSGFEHHLNGSVVTKLPVFPLSVDLAANMSWPIPGLPRLHVMATTPNSTQNLDVDLLSPHILNISKSHDQTEGRPAFDWAWTIMLIGNTVTKHTLRWNPLSFSQNLMSSVQKLRGVGQSLEQAGIILAKNVHKNITDRIVPFINKTIGAIIGQYIRPHLHSGATGGHPHSASSNPLSSPRHRHQTTPIQQPSPKLTIVMHVVQGIINSSSARVVQTAATIAMVKIGRWLQQPPPFMELFLQNVKLRIKSLIAQGEVEFTIPLFFRWDNFISAPKPIQIQEYLLSLPLFNQWRQTSTDQLISTKKMAVIQDGQHIYTFDGSIYSIPGGSVSGCTYLLAADLRGRSYSMLSSGNSVSILTKLGTVTVNFNNNVFINSCTRPVDLPYSSKGLSVVRKGESIQVETELGISMICDIPYKLCSLQLPRQHHNNTLGLFGTNDGEKTTDMRMLSGVLVSDISKFLEDYVLGSSSSCPVTVEEEVPGICDGDYQLQCGVLFGDKNSVLNGCFHALPTSPFLTKCQNVQCTASAMGVCDLAVTYAHLCAGKGLHLQLPTSPVSCVTNGTSVSTATDRAAVDIIFVISEHQSMQKNGGPKSHLQNLLSNMPLSDMLIGIVGYGGADAYIHPHIAKFSGRHFGSQIELMDDQLLLRTDGKVHVDAFEAVKLAASFPFRSYSKRIIFLLTTDEITREFADIEALSELLLQEKIILNVFTEVKNLGGKRVVGANYDGMQIHMKKGKSSTVDLPKGDYTQLMMVTEGSVFDISTIMGRSTNKVLRIVRHLETQIYDPVAHICEG